MPTAIYGNLLIAPRESVAGCPYPRAWVAHPENKIIRGEVAYENVGNRFGGRLVGLYRGMVD
ncbi:MAG: hypothetical protein ACREEA_05040, partial [Stellaceae bacterium]